MDARPEGGNQLGPGVLKTVENAVDRLQARLDGQELLVHVSRRVERDLCSFTPALVATRLDGLANSDSMSKKEVCAKKNKDQKLEAES